MTARGKFFLTLFILGLVGFGVWKWWDKLKPALLEDQPPTPVARDGSPRTTPPVSEPALDLVVPETTRPALPPAAIYQPRDGIVEVDISEYAGYAGLIVANGGLEPTPDSFFFQQHGFKVRLSISEEEAWSRLNAGKIAATVTTADALAVQGRAFQAVVPVQFGFSRGADAVVVRKNFRRVNDLQGRTLVTSNFTETDFFIRYLAQEAGIGVHLRTDLQARPDPEKINLVFAVDGFAAGDVFLADLQSGANRLAGCVTWEPKVTEVVQASQGGAHVLISNKNLLIIADVLIVNRAFAEQFPALVVGLVDGILAGNSMVRDTPEKYLDVIARSFSWTREDTRRGLAKVHLSNLPENLAFFNGSIDSAGSFGGIYQTSIIAYGPEIVRDPLDPNRYIDMSFLKILEKSGKYAAQKIDIAPIRSGSSSQLEYDPLLSKDIRFFFEPNSAELKPGDPTNAANFENLKRMLQVSPGSVILLRGHVDNALVPEFRKQGGEAFVRQMALKAFELSRNRALAVKNTLVSTYGIPPERLETVGRGWEEPVSETDNEKNRRVEAQWYTVE